MATIVVGREEAGAAAAPLLEVKDLVVSFGEGESKAAAVNGGGLQYEHQSLSGAEAIAAAGGSTTTTATATMAMTGGGTTTAGAPRPIVKSERENIGRNDPCWCGSGKKFKKCHGA